MKINPACQLTILSKQRELVPASARGMPVLCAASSNKNIVYPRFEFARWPSTYYSNYGYYRPSSPSKQTNTLLSIVFSAPPVPLLGTLPFKVKLSTTTTAVSPLVAQRSSHSDP